MTVQSYLQTHTLPTPGAKVRLTALYSAFQKQLPAAERVTFTKRMFCAELDRLGVIRGLGPSGQIYCGNLTLGEKQIVKSGAKLVVVPRVDPLAEFIRTHRDFIQHD